MLWQAAVTGLHPEGALVAGELVRAHWLWAPTEPVPASAGGQSSIPHKLDARPEKNLRFAFRRHYRVAP